MSSELIMLQAVGRTDGVGLPAGEVRGKAGCDAPDVIAAQVLGAAVDGHLEHRAAIHCSASACVSHRRCLWPHLACPASCSSLTKKPERFPRVMVLILRQGWVRKGCSISLSQNPSSQVYLRMHGHPHHALRSPGVPATSQPLSRGF